MEIHKMQGIGIKIHRSAPVLVTPVVICHVNGGGSGKLGEEWLNFNNVKLLTVYHNLMSLGID